MALEKMFLLPPLKGLNLYDNPFTMPPDFAVELQNFMPPTTTFLVRPAREIITTFNGQVRGMFSYQTGVTIDYGEHWYNSTIRYGAADELLLKVVGTNGKATFLKLEGHSQDLKLIGNLGNADYDDDFALFKHTLFFTSGQQGSTMNLYNQPYGLAGYTLTIGEEGQTEISNMQNLVLFKNFLFLSSASELNLYYIESQYADSLDPINSTFWKSVENIFSSHNGKSYKLDGIFQKGGSIIKLTTMARSGSDTISSYLAVITDKGEVALFDGTDPSDDTKWNIIGRFEISPPLNKFCFVDMEGDLIVATKNGLVSLRRVCFGQTTQISENLEYKILSLFTQYMFKIPQMSDFIGLYYYARNRLLIFNVPTDLPMPFNFIVISYIFNKNKSLIFPIEASDGRIPVTTKNRMVDFINSFIVPNCLDYTLTIELNGDYNNNAIILNVSSIVTEDKETQINNCVTTLDFYIKIEGKQTSFFSTTFTISNIDNFFSLAVAVVEDWKWDAGLAKETSDGTIYSFSFPQNDGEYVVTNIMSQTSVFYTRQSMTTLASVTPGEDLSDYRSLNIVDFLYFNKKVFTPQEFYGLPNYVPNVFETISVHEYWDKTPFGVSVPVIDALFGYGHAASYICMYMTAITYGWCPTKENDPLQGMSFTLNASFWINDNEYKITITPGMWTDAYEEGPGPTQPNGRHVIFQIGITMDNPNDASKPIRQVINWKNLSYSNEGIIGSVNTLDNGILVSIWENRYMSVEVQTENIPQFITWRKTDKVKFTYDPANITWSSPMEQWDQNIKQSLLEHVWPMWGNGWKEWMGASAAGMILSLSETDEMPRGISKVKKRISQTNVGAAASYQQNIDLKSIPLFDNIDICCDYASTQYVFDSHFGTWSTFKDVNLSKGVEHQSDFYFVVPNDVKFTQSGYVTTSSSLCKFNSDQFGDMQYDLDNPAVFKYNPIEVKYKTVPTFDLGKPVKKILKRLKVFGNPSAFYQPGTYPDNPYPLQFTPWSDFKTGQPVDFIHAFDSDPISTKILKRHFAGKRSVHELSFGEKQKFWKLYKAENDMIIQVNLPLIANPGSRFGLEMSMDIKEAYVNIYGFEIFFEAGQQIL
jgi:hypothetical protein